MDIPILDSGRENLTSIGRIVTREEYDALLSELAQDFEPEHAVLISDASQPTERLRKLEFNLMILVGLILVVFILCRTS
jgi:hypothetical protein